MTRIWSIYPSGLGLGGNQIQVHKDTFSTVNSSTRDYYANYLIMCKTNYNNTSTYDILYIH